VVAPDPALLERATSLSFDPGRIAELDCKPLYQFSEGDLDLWLAWLQAIEADPLQRVMKLARKSIGQPYELFLLGEFPFELHDPQPLYCLGKSDCVVFVEHIYAMALSKDWPSFFQLLQRIRYHQGHIGLLTRNHYTEADWNPNNAWLVQDLTDALPGGQVAHYQAHIDRARFFKTRYGLDVPWEVEDLQVSYIPLAALDLVQDQLQPGDLVNVVVGKKDDRLWVTHVGLISRDERKSLNFLHSAEPAVREEPMAQFIERYEANREERLARDQPTLRGFRFLRLLPQP
jgi:hypothetical protein